MGDCGSFSLDLEELTCTGDIRAWTAALLAREQAAIDHLIACIHNVILPELDICVLKDDLPHCPADAVTMVSFELVTYGEEGDIGVLPYPDRVGEFEFRTGLKQSPCVSCDAWTLDTVVFDTPFPNDCVFVDVVVDKAQDLDCPTSVPPSGANVMQIHAPLVRSLSKTGFSVYFCGDDFGASRKLTYRYFAAGN